MFIMKLDNIRVKHSLHLTLCMLVLIYQDSLLRVYQMQFI